MAQVEYKKMEDINEKGNLIKRVKFKPLHMFVIALVAGLIAAVAGFLIPQKWVFVFGVFAVFYSSWSLFSIPDRWVVSIYDDALIFFSAEPNQRAFRIDAKDIVEYNVGKTEKQHLYVRLKSGEEYKAKSYRYDSKVTEALKMALPGKETDEIAKHRSEKKTNK